MPLSRRALLRLAAPASAAAMWPATPRAAGYRVGVGRERDPYAATRRALAASGEWSGLMVQSRTVVIKPNLVGARASETGATTDPEVVRAIVDRALGDGAVQVDIVEAAPQGAHFSACGYDFFRTYDPQGRVRLVDLSDEAQVLAPVSGGLAYEGVHTAASVLGPDVVFVSAAKLKTHGDAVASLSMKNLFGLPAVDRYLSSPPAGRFAMHDRGVHQTVVDLNCLRPVDFAVVDGVWGMEGNGPLFGTPVAMNTVLAGRNALAVDRVGVSLMQISQRAVRHLDYAAQLGLGPMELDAVTLAGDPLTPRAFALPPLPPFVEFPRVQPASFTPAADRKATVGVYYAQPCRRRLEILRLSDENPSVDLVRTLDAYAIKPQGFEFLQWDGRTEDGTLAPPGRYAAHLRAYRASGYGRPTDGVGWVSVVDSQR
jgi:uncharacterized protein (DUF362 family)